MLSGYYLVRTDSPDNVKKHGVAIFIKSSRKCSHVSNVTLIYLCDSSLYILMVFPPPSNSSDNNSSLFHFISEFWRPIKRLFCKANSTCHLSNGTMLIYWIPMFYHLILYAITFYNVGMTQIVHKATNFPSGIIIDFIVPYI